MSRRAAKASKRISVTRLRVPRLPVTSSAVVGALTVASFLVAFPSVLTGGASSSALTASRTLYQQKADGTISGKVVNASGDPIDDVCVTASRKPHSGSEACTGSTGSYTIDGLSSGNYRVYFIPYATDVYLVPQVYPGLPGLDIRQGTKVHVTSGRATTGIGATLTDGGRVEVIVRSNAGPVSDVEVCPLFDQIDRGDGNCGGTDLTGSGTTGGVPVGTSKVATYSSAGKIYAPGTRSFVKAEPVQVSLDQTTVVDVDLPASSS